MPSHSMENEESKEAREIWKILNQSLQPVPICPWRPSLESLNSLLLQGIHSLPLCEIIPNSILAVISLIFKNENALSVDSFSTRLSFYFSVSFYTKVPPQKTVACTHCYPSPHDLSPMICLLFRTKSIFNPKDHSY